MWVLGHKPEFSGRAGSTLNIWAISQATTFLRLEKVHSSRILRIYSTYFEHNHPLHNPSNPSQNHSYQTPFSISCPLFIATQSNQCCLWVHWIIGNLPGTNFLKNTDFPCQQPSNSKVFSKGRGHETLLYIMEIWLYWSYIGIVQAVIAIMISWVYQSCHAQRTHRVIWYPNKGHFSGDNELFLLL